MERVEKENDVVLDSKRDPRAKRSRRDMADAFVYLLQSKDFNQITIKEIVNRAMVSRITFYNQFKDKFDLLQYVFKRSVNEILVEINKDVNASEKKSGMELLKIAITDLVHYLFQNKEQLTKWIDNDSSKAIYWCLTNFVREVLTEILNRYTNAFDIPANVSQKLLIDFYAGGFTNALYEISEDAIKSEEKVVSSLMSLMKTK